MTHRTLFPPPDEKRALEQLERLHREIQRARRDRERAGAEFEGFVQDFRSAPDAAGRQVEGEPASRRVSRPIAPSPSPQPADSDHRVAAAGPSGHARGAAVAPASAPTERPAPHVEPQGVVPSARGFRQRLVLPIAATVLIGGLAFVYFWQRTHETVAPPATSATNPTTAPSASAPQPKPVSPPAPSPVVSPSTVHLTTARTVWLRIIVDGERVLERELPGGQQLTYTPASSIVIRAGDAGALRVKVGSGPDEVLGRDAFPATRRFTVRPSTSRP